MKYFLFFVFLLCSNYSVLAWFDLGHCWIAQIMWDQLSSDEQNKLFYILKDWETLHYEFPGDLYGAATWPDSIKKKPYNIEVMANMHFIDYVYNPEKVPNVPDHIREDNVIFGLTNAFETLTSKRDIHQPFHNINGYWKNLPNGDHGGNLYKIDNPFGNLHFYWDAIAGSFNIQYPYSPEIIVQIQANATRIQKQYPISFFSDRFSPTDFNFTKWSLESNEYCVKYCYQIEQNEKPSELYFENSLKISEQQLAIAGYRGSVVLKKVLNI